MSSTIRPAPVRRSVEVAVEPARAFAVFTEGMHRWWLAGHSLLKVPRAAILLEPHAGGRWGERGVDGSECPWGRVLAWEPPARVVLAWQIGATWTYDPALLTEIEIRFVPVAGGTRVELEHRGLERYGDAADGVRAALDSEQGWSGELASFAAACG